MRFRVLAVMTLALILAASAMTRAQRAPVPDDPTIGQEKAADPTISQVKAADPGLPELVAAPAPNSALSDGPALPLSPAPDPVAAPAPVPEDPMEVVEAFVTRNRKEAAGAVESLTKEAEVLRARLQKVEAALARWQAVARALEVPDQPPAEAAKAEAPSEVGTIEPFQGPEPAPQPEPPREVPKAAG